MHRNKVECKMKKAGTHMSSLRFNFIQIDGRELIESHAERELKMKCTEYGSFESN